MAWRKKNNMKPNLAIVSPSQSAYSETFIQAHKSIPDMNIRFYYGGVLPTMLEEKGALAVQRMWLRVIRQIILRAAKSPLSLEEDAFARSLRREKIDCVLAEYGPTGAGVLNVCRTLNLPLLVHFHGYDASKHQVLEQYKTAYEDMFRYASAVIVVSRAMQKKIEELGCPAEKIWYSPCGPHEMFLNINPRFAQKLFISLGRFVDKKAHYYTLLAFKTVLDIHPDARLIIAGDGILLNTCINLVRALKIEHAVSFPGVISPDEFAAYLTVACAYVQHSITALDGDMEGTPVSVMEASAAGIPVISTHHAGIPDVIIEGETGLLMDEHDVEGMSKHMLRVLEDKEFAKKLGASGKRFISENFSREKHLGLISQAIRNSKCSEK
jgi:colanic acid/amylovoran biosynthesis glycosyltransferase